MDDAERTMYEEEIDAAYDEMWKAKRNFIFALSFALMVSFFLFRAHVKLADSPTWQEVVRAMPTSIKQDIAIDFCVSHRRMCSNLPLNSPIQPMDGGKHE